MTNHDLIGFSPKFRAVVDQIQLVAPAECTVLVHGETGTGKEVIARAIHEASPRRKGRFVAFNCAAIPSGLIESELFGHERGAFTGAVSQSVGRFQSADGGTLFLDEIGDLPLELQPKLLRALQERQFERLGGGRSVAVNVRVIAATNQNLWRMVQDRSFRADLFYRLNVFPITLPPLRERREDIPALVEYFVKTYAARQGKSIETIPDDVMEDLKWRNWHGNIRELQNYIERAVILSPGSELRPPATESAPEQTPGRTLEDIVKLHITEILRERNWMVGGPSGAAALLGIPRTTLLAKMRKLGIARPAPVQPAFSRPEPAAGSFPGEFAASARA